MKPRFESALRGPVQSAARRVLGGVLKRGSVVLRIVEVEAYGGPEDSASHARFGLTPRNAPMWGPAGRLYVYRVYGLHWMLNLTVGPAGSSSAILIRGAEVMAGWPVVRRRRGRTGGDGLARGPGCVAQSLGVRGEDSGRVPAPWWGARRGLEVRLGRTGVGVVMQGPRIGIDYADAADRTKPWRFWIAESAGVSKRRSGGKTGSK